MPMPAWLARVCYDFVYTSVFWGLTLGGSVRVVGARNLPRRGPALVLANHTSFLDPMVAGLALNRRVGFVARASLFRHPWVGWFLRGVGTIPIEHRGFSRAGVQGTLDALGRGQAVLMFPEGERSHDGTVQPFKPGLALLIGRTRAPIVPAGIAGAFAAWPRHRKFPRPAPLFLPPTDGTLAVSLGAPIDPAKYDGWSRADMLADLADAVRAEVVKAERIRRK